MKKTINPILSNIGDVGCDLHAYIPIIGADLARKKTCFGGLALLPPIRETLLLSNSADSMHWWSDQLA